MGKTEQKADNSLIEVTLTDLTRCGYPREHVKQTLAKINPTRRAGRIMHYDLAVAIRALNSGELDAKSRKELAQAELAEEKARRMKLESVDAKEVRNLWTDKLVRIRDTIKATEGLTRSDQRNLTITLKTEMDRVDEEIRSAAFVEGAETEE